MVSKKADSASRKPPRSPRAHGTKFVATTSKSPASLSPDALKALAAQGALSYIQDGMTVGLGTGSTAALFIRQLGEMARKKKYTLTCVATSQASQELARMVGLRVVGLPDITRIDVAVDGADQVDNRRRLIKGYGGALTREKVVEYAAKKFIVIADEGKHSAFLDKPVPVEILPFASATVKQALLQLGAQTVTLRTRESMADEITLSPLGQPFVTDNGLWILHAHFGRIANPAQLEADINRIPGVLENGLFCHGVYKVVLGTAKGIQKF
jgi:ribose 5-phosphate isomerase A